MLGGTDYSIDDEHDDVRMMDVGVRDVMKDDDDGFAKDDMVIRWMSDDCGDVMNMLQLGLQRVDDGHGDYIQNEHYLQAQKMDPRQRQPPQRPRRPSKNPTCSYPERIRRSAET